MGWAVALPLVASLALQATAGMEFGVQAEGRSTTLAPSRGPTQTRTSVSTAPSAAVVVEASHLRAAAAYVPRIWTSDVEDRTSPLVIHELDVRIGTRRDRPWRLEATASGMRGETDPLADPLLAATPGVPSQVATAGPLPYEAFRTAARGEFQPDLRTTLGASAEWYASRARTADARVLLPAQRGATVDASLAHRITERDVLRVSATTAGTVTDAPVGETTGVAVTGFATWRRWLTPRLEGWTGGGATLAFTDEPARPATREVSPAGELGLARAGAGLRLVGDFAVRMTTFVDRFAGDVSPMIDGRCSLTWLVADRLSLAGSASGGRRTDGETALAAADLRAIWTLHPRFALEAGLVGRWQHERRPEIPSFREGGIVLALRSTTGRL